MTRSISGHALPGADRVLCLGRSPRKAIEDHAIDADPRRSHPVGHRHGKRNIVRDQIAGGEDLPSLCDRGASLGDIRAEEIAGREFDSSDFVAPSRSAWVPFPEPCGPIMMMFIRCVPCPVRTPRAAGTPCRPPARPIG